MKSYLIKRLALLSVCACFCSPLADANDRVLKVWHSEFDAATLLAVEDIAARFESENQGIKIEVSPVGWVDLQKKIATAVEGGAPPDLMQLEPHHVAYLVSKGLLQPIDSVINKVGGDRIFDAVRNLQYYNGHYYGIAHGLGISYVGIRADLLDSQVSSEIDTWDDLLALYREFNSKNSDIPPLLLPANDLHLTILFSELLASNNGTIFTADGEVDFTSRQVKEVLAFMRELYMLLPAQLRSTEYIENFTYYALGNTFSLPGFFGRGTLAIERQSPDALRSPEIFSFVAHPRGPSAVAIGSPGYATIDAEPWVIPAQADSPELAKAFLEFFYRVDNYLMYALSVPIHLTPIFRDVAMSPEYLQHPHVKKWKPYHEQLLKQLDEGSIRPIFMSALDDRLRPALFRLEGTRVVPDLVRKIYAGESIDETVRWATKEASRMTAGLPSEVFPLDSSALGEAAQDRSDPEELSLWAKAGWGFVIIICALLVAWVIRRQGIQS